MIGTMLSASMVSGADALTVKIPYRNTTITRNVDFNKLFEKSLSEMLKLYKINIEKPITKQTTEFEKTTQATIQEEKLAPEPEKSVTKPVPTPASTPVPEPIKSTPTPEPTKSTPAPTPVQASTDSGFSSYQQDVLNIVNKERTSRGLSALKLSSEVSKVASTKSQDMVNKGYFDHNSPTYGSPFDMMNQFGISYRSAAENIAMGQRNPQEVMNGWMNSDGHRKNILNSSFTGMGIGIAKDSNGRLYWTQMFIGK
jgi:uncharacterized YkwD family protein